MLENPLTLIYCGWWAEAYSGGWGMESHPPPIVGGRGAKVLQTYRPSDEAGPRGAFAPKKRSIYCSGMQDYANKFS